ncbi:Pet127-domain-containing protein [Gymnopus androsaceus JB14]|uniref:Pet127-domain-containing protein n=1 Tax=Gymnopus androsaceus JB14 TaxID=1447944 RepID=A0A6A4I205_9AGAR|nr:Pet127-domain-containing protein [Gymnopus androsaceus JB14]
MGYGVIPCRLSLLLSKRSSTQWARGYSKKSATTGAFAAKLKAKVKSIPSDGKTANIQQDILPKNPAEKKKARRKPKTVVPTDPERELEGEPSESNRQGWSGETWKEDWGEDKLSASPTSDSRGAPPHISFPIAYSRRIEGLLEDAPKTVLQDLTPFDEAKSNRNPKSWIRACLVQSWPSSQKLKILHSKRLTGFIRSSRDQDLWSLAKKEGRKFGGSTSSLSGMLCHIYFLLSAYKTVDTSTLSSDFRREAPTFTPGQRMAASVVFNHSDGVYSIDSDPNKDGDSDKNILLWMGTLLERYLTSSSEDFFLTCARTRPHKTRSPTSLSEKHISDKFVLRSQLDCYDPRLPGTGVFDIKTRACLPIRMDLLNFKESSGYIIRQNVGFYESFEREYYDLIRSAFLKYQFQARIGNMDGVFVAYHNTARIFGFQYVPLVEMDQRLFGEAPGVGDRVFQKCMETLELVSEEIISCFPGQSVKCTFETEDGLAKDMNVWVEPVDWPQDAKEERPIKQIVVTAASFSGNLPAKGGTCVGAIDQPWTVHWSITHLSSDSDKNGLNSRHIPTGVTPKTIAEWWDSLDFNGSKKINIPLTPLDDDGSEGIEVDPSAVERPPRSETFFKDNFAMPDHRIIALRDLAVAGRQETIRIGLEDRGKPKVLLGVGEIEWEDTLAEEEIAAKARQDEAAAGATQADAEDNGLDWMTTPMAEEATDSAGPNEVLAEHANDSLQDIVPEAPSHDENVSSEDRPPST